MQPHEVLGVQPGPTRREVVEAYRRFALRHHPDRGGDPSTFQAGADAYRRLMGTTAGDRRPPVTSPRADVVFHRRHRRGVQSLLRLARRRLATPRSLA